MELVAILTIACDDNVQRKNTKQEQSKNGPLTKKLEMGSDVIEEKASSADRSQPQYALCRNRENTEKCKIFLSKVYFPITRRLLQWLLKKNVAIIKCTFIDNKNVRNTLIKSKYNFYKKTNTF